MSIISVPNLKEIKTQEDCFNKDLNGFVILYKEENVGNFQEKILRNAKAILIF